MEGIISDLFLSVTHPHPDPLPRGARGERETG